MFLNDVTGKLYIVFLHLLLFSGIRFECVFCTEKQFDSEAQSVGSNDPAEVPGRERPSSNEDVVRKDISLEHNEQPVISPDEKTKLFKRLHGDPDAATVLIESNSTGLDITQENGNSASTTISFEGDPSEEPPRPLTESDSAIEYAAETESDIAWNPTKAPSSKNTTKVSSTPPVTDEGYEIGHQTSNSMTPKDSRQSWTTSSVQDSSVGFDEPSEVLYTVTEKNLEVSSTTDVSSTSESHTVDSSSISEDDSASGDFETLESPENNETSKDVQLFVNSSSTSEFDGDKSNDTLQEPDATIRTLSFNGSAVELLSSSEHDHVSTNILQPNMASVQFVATSSSSLSSSEWTVDDRHLMSSLWTEHSSKSTMETASRLFTTEVTTEVLVTSSAIELQSAVTSRILYVPLLSSVYSVVDYTRQSNPSLPVSPNASISPTVSSPITPGEDIDRPQHGNELRHETLTTSTKHFVVEEDSVVILGAVGPMEVEPTKADDKQEESVPEEVESHANDADDDHHNVQDDDTAASVPLKESKPRGHEDAKTEDGSPKEEEEESEPKITAVVNETVKLLHSNNSVTSAVSTLTINRTYSGLFDGSTASNIPMLLSSMVSNSVFVERTLSPMFDFATPSYFNSTFENRQQMNALNTTITEDPPKAFDIPIVATKATTITDRRTKYNRLPTERNTDEKEDHVTESSFKPDVVLPTIRVPVAYLSVTMKCSWLYFCMQRLEFQKEFARQLKSAVKMNVGESQVVFFNVNVCKHIAFMRNLSAAEAMNAAITVPLYVSDEWGVYSKSLTELLGVLIIRNRHRILNNNNNNVTIPNVVLAVQLHRKEESMTYTQKNANLDGDQMGIIAVIAISCIAGICLVLLFILLYVLKRRHGLKEKTRRCRPVGDAYSLDSVSSIHSSFRRRKMRASKRSYLNQGFDDPHVATNKLNFTGLANACVDDEALAEEYKQIPMQMARYEELPVGAEVKNRYANIIPFPETRIVLASKTDETGSDYINANYVRGCRGEQKRYIACQAPLTSTITDFWQMVWENQCKVIVMLTAIEEDGMNKCAPYFSETDTLDCHRLYGDFQVTTKKKDVRESYTVTALQLKNLEKNLMRDVVHFWYTSWSTQHVPIDRNSIAELLVETRAYTKSNSGPMVVHCSPGTGRTGTVIAIDICMHDFELTRVVDIPQCVHKLRQDRGGCVQTSEQYIFIYEVLGEYASRLMNHSGRSSVRSTK